MNGINVVIKMSYSARVAIKNVNIPKLRQRACGDRTWKVSGNLQETRLPQTPQYNKGFTWCAQQKRTLRSFEKLSLRNPLGSTEDRASSPVATTSASGPESADKAAFSVRLSLWGTSPKGSKWKSLGSVNLAATGNRKNELRGLHSLSQHAFWVWHRNSKN